MHATLDELYLFAGSSCSQNKLSTRSLCALLAKMCPTLKLYYNYTMCGHSVGAPAHMVGPPCKIANSYKPGQFYCPVEFAEWKTVFQNLDEPCLSCKQTKHWFLLTDENGKETWSARLPIAFGDGETDVRKPQEKFRLPFKKDKWPSDVKKG